MTTSYERTRALLQARELLRDLASPDSSLRSSEELRGRAASLLRHYPEMMDLRLLHQTLPMLFADPETEYRSS